MKTKILLASIAMLGSIQLSAYTYEVSPLIGKNFTENGALVDDSTAYGIRLNKYISEDNAIMFGYTRINSADYKNGTIGGTLGSKDGRSCGCGCPVVAPCPKPKVDECDTGNHCSQTDTDTGNDLDTNGNTSDSDTNSNTENSGSNTSGTDTGSNNGTNSGSTGGNDDTNTDVLSASSHDTDINRFYINGLHNITTSYSKLVPYVYGGFGYEHVENEFSDNDSQGFFNAGGGLKYRVTDKLSLISDIQGIKKFRSHDLDILASLGLGVFFGAALQPEPEALVASGFTDVIPQAPKREITVVKVAPQAEAVAPVLTAPVGEYYVQIAAGFKTDMETGCKHTRDLRNAGIDYDIKYTTIKGKNAALVVVGPFETKKEAASHLPELRTYSKDAFVKRIKG